MTRQYDVAIVGAGVVGLAHALAARRRGLSVVVFERDTQALGASVRNFGLGLVVGQAPGEMLDLALRSRATWLELLAATGCAHKTAGSIIVARDAVELAVLEEFQATQGERYGTRLATAAECAAQSLHGLAGLHSPHEIGLEARMVIPRLAAWLAEAQGVEFVWQAQVNAIELPRIRTSRGDYYAARAIVCSGHDTQTLFPAAFAPLGIRRCALQMLRVADPGIALAPAAMTGLSTLHYPAFAGCGSLGALRDHIAERSPDLLAHGIHLIVQQLGERGDVLVGDSHHYGESVSPFNHDEVDALLLSLASSLLGKSLQVRERWQGVYASGPNPYEIVHPAEGVSCVMITAGVGMSIGLALAERQFQA